MEATTGGVAALSEADPSRQAELALGQLRGRLAELNTQLARAEQDLTLPRSFWARRSLHRQATAWRSRLVGRLRRRRSGPLVSILTPVFDTPEHVLRACLASVTGQTHQQWEHVLVDDGSSTQRQQTFRALVSQSQARAQRA